jgi:molybdopterin molybdotransferase
MENRILTLEDALQIIAENVSPLAVDDVELADAVGRVLAQDVVSDVCIPPFDKSAMDGYACKKTSLAEPMHLVGEISAGMVWEGEIGYGECVRIFTGAPVPASADIVVMQEHVEITSEKTIKIVKQSQSDNICKKGEDVMPGDVVLKSGTMLKPQHIPVLANVGATNVSVYRKPLVGVLVTGSELVDASVMPLGGQIRNSNGPQMVAQLQHKGYEVWDAGIAPDERNALAGAMLTALEKCDVLVVSGGVSVGDYDLVPVVSEEIGFVPLFGELNTKPGKHTLLCKSGNKYILGLPGNPVSAFVQLLTVGCPLLSALQKNKAVPLRLGLNLASRFKRKKADRHEFIPVRFTALGSAEILPYHGSAHINAYANADGLLEVPAGVFELAENSTVYVRPI